MARSPKLKKLLAKPELSVQLRYEVCRAYYLEQLSAPLLAERFGLHIYTLQAIVRDFAASPDLTQIFQVPRTGPKSAPKREVLLQQALELRHQGLSIGQILQRLHTQGHEISTSYLATLLRQQGFPRLPRRGPSRPGTMARDGSEVPAIADARELDLESGRTVPTQVAGLFLFVPLLMEHKFSKAVQAAGYPGTNQIPSLQALLGLLAPKLLGKRRVSYISDLCTDEGAGLYAGLNFLPKTTYSTDYSYKTNRAMNEKLVDQLIAQIPMEKVPLQFNLDFHIIPFRGQESDLENHWVPKKHQGGPSVMAFVAQEEARKVICYATANIVRKEADNMVMKFADHWKQQSGRYPARLLFDSRATVYSALNKLEHNKIGFITIRQRGSAMLKRIRNMPKNKWKQCQVVQAKGRRRKVKYIDEKIKLDGYDKEIRQIVFEGLGHEKPTFLITNDRPKELTACQTLKVYASRNHVEHALGKKITFFHLDCLASEIRLNVDFDLTLTITADLLYNSLAKRIKGFEEATPQSLFRRFVNTQGKIEIQNRTVHVNFAKRAHNPLLKEAGFETIIRSVPWLNGYSVQLNFP